MKKIHLLLSLTIIFLTFTACSSSSSTKKTSDEETSTKQTISGYVIDPAVEGSTISLKCTNKTYYASSKSSEDGSFSIKTIDENESLDSCTLLAAGGNDGDDLTGLTLKSSASLFTDKKGLYITPFTTSVVTHDSFQTDMQSAISGVATFLGVSTEDLIKDPTSTVSLAKIAKKMTKIALAKDNDGKLVGYVDIDDSTITQNSLDDYVSIDLSSTLSTTEKSRLDTELEEVNNATSVAEILKLSIQTSIFKKLKKAYNQDSYSSEQITNLKQLSVEIVVANSTTDGSEEARVYKKVSSYQLRKALTDLSLTPTFSDDIGTILKTELEDTLSLSSESFDAYIATKSIDIKDIEGAILFDSATYKSILGDDNEKRRNYYAHSDKSNISKALSLAKDNYSDDVNDPIMSEVANGLAKLGFYDEAMQLVKTNVYTPTQTQEAYRALGKIYLLAKLNDQAIDAFYNEFLILKNEIESLGKANFSSSQQSSIQAIARYLGEAGDTERTEEVITYLEQTGPYLSTTSSYARLTQAFEDLAESVYIENNNLVQAKSYAIKAAQSVEQIPTDKAKTAVYYTYRTALTATFFNENTYAQNAVNRANEIDPTNAYSGYGKSYEYYPAVLDAFNNSDLDEVITNINAMSSNTDKKFTLNYGAAAALFLNGKADELFNTFYTNSSIFSRQYYISEHVKLAPSTTMPNVLIIKLLGTDEQLEDYLDRMHALAKTWVYTSDSNAQAVLAEWGTKLKSRESYLAMAALYKDLGKEDKAKAIITESLTKVNAFSDMSQKIESLINIFAASKELGLENSSEKEIILENLESAASMSSFTEIDTIIEVANILSVNSKKDEAEVLVNKAYSLVDSFVSGDLENIQDRTKLLIGKYSTVGSETISIAAGYFQAGKIERAKEIIQENLENINSLVASAEQYKLFVDVSVAYGLINDLSSVNSIISKIQTTEQSNKAKVLAAKAFANYDVFNQSDIASVDSDLDGKPDFWNKNASEDDINSSSLILDDDIDNDGIDDTHDELPYDAI